jgi:hypothetical protein
MGPSVDDGPDARDHHADMNSNRSSTVARIIAEIKRATQSAWFDSFVSPASAHPPMTGTVVVQ